MHIARMGAHGPENAHGRMMAICVRVVAMPWAMRMSRPWAAAGLGLITDLNLRFCYCNRHEMYRIQLSARGQLQGFGTPAGGFLNSPPPTTTLRGVLRRNPAGRTCLQCPQCLQMPTDAYRCLQMPADACRCICLQLQMPADAYWKS